MRQVIPISDPEINPLLDILTAQNFALGKAFAALSNIRDWAHQHYLGDSKIADTTLAQLLDDAIDGLAP